MSKTEMIKFKLSNCPLFAKKLNVNEKLNEIRTKFQKELPKDSLFFCSDGTQIKSEDEKDFILKDVIEKEENAYVLHLKNKENEESIQTLNDLSISGVESQDQNTDGNIDEDCGENDMEDDQSGIEVTLDFSDLLSLILFSQNPQDSNPPPPAVNSLIQNRTENNMPIPKIKPEDLSKFELIEQKGELKIYLYPSDNFTVMDEKNALSFMVVGETGCGKTTLLNSFINSLLGVEFEDNFRFKIIKENSGKSQAYSQTGNVNYYNIKSVGGYPPVKIIDTPGFGDTRGIEGDKEIKEQIRQFFQNKISTLNAVCFVTKSSNNRLSHSQKFILNSILDLFGEDVKEIFIFMLTFCDGGKPNIIDILQEKDCPFNEIIKLNKEENWYYKFNNSAIFEENRNDEFTKMFWKLGMKNFKEFQEKLKTLPKNCLSLSKAVLDQRENLEIKVQALSQKLKVGLNKIEQIKEIIKIAHSLTGDLNDCKDYTRKISYPAIKKIPKHPNFYATTCIICTKTCHDRCTIKDDEKKKKCYAMDKDGNCTICPKKCPWKEHKNRDYILEDYVEEKIITLEELKKRYNYSKGELSAKRKIFLGARDELIKLNIECLQTQNDITESINLLRKIALNKSVFESSEEHIDLLIEVEKSEHKFGWQKRINSLNELKNQKKMLREIYKGENQTLNQIKEFVEKKINDYCDIDIDNLENDDIKINEDKCSIF